MNRNDDFKTVVVVDFMSMIRKVPFHVHKNKNEALESTWAMILSPGIINQNEHIDLTLHVLTLLTWGLNLQSL